MAWYWHRVVPLLAAAHHEVIAVDLPAEDSQFGLNEYADIVLRAIEKRTNVILVAQSLGGFTAPLVCARAQVRMLVFVNAMIPQPGETAGAWWENTGAIRARTAAAKKNGYSQIFDPATYFLHDVPDEVLRNGPSSQRDQSERVFADACHFKFQPDLRIRVIASAGDRFFPLDFQRRVAPERLNALPKVVPGGHLVALSNPPALADALPQLAREKPIGAW